MSQGGLKHVATEPTRLESKRERRRGAAGRAAALRRAPSDSDCSGETASLSADSGDRSVRPAPPPPRSGKSRSSRRRGSEWEVLEGLKDGQRFEKRPEVFNGYLHKKRKWPLKGWHKRFFVVDGGILVYARSPTDVARGRLHGSVDVGLSVISAKARRRRIDIDADEFIYHLRAKTPDVFRTWLNVLKAHRLYRQHLLTFGARESVPKIHAPLEDMPPTDTSSHASDFSTPDSSLENIQNQRLWELQHILAYPLLTSPPNMYDFIKKCDRANANETQNAIKNWDNYTKNNLMPITNNLFAIKKKSRSLRKTHLSPCSMNCLEANEMETVIGNKVFTTWLRGTDVEKQMNSTDLENDFKSPEDMSSFFDKYSLNSPNVKVHSLSNVYITETNIQFDNIEDGSAKCRQGSHVSNKKIENTQTLFIFTRNNRLRDNPVIRKSRKSTNLLKYKNLGQEPPLGKQLSKFMILGKHKGPIEIDNTGEYESPINQVNTQAVIANTAHIRLQNTVSDYDAIAEKLMLSIFNSFKYCSESNKNVDIKTYLNQIVKELYNINLELSAVHPVKKLFRCLLEYWLNNTTHESLKDINKMTKSIERQSNKYFTKDVTTSNSLIRSVSKATQFHDPGQLYLKDVLDKITTTFSSDGKNQTDREDKNTAKSQNQVKEWSGLKFSKTTKDKLGNNKTGNRNENFVTIDISKYRLEHISMTNNASIKGTASRTMKLKEKPPNAGEHKNINLNLKFADGRTKEENTDNCFLVDITNSSKLFHSNVVDPSLSIQNPFINMENYDNNDNIQVKPYMSSIDSCDDMTCDTNILFNKLKLKPSLSDGTSKGYRPETSFLDTQSYHAFNNGENLDKSVENKMQNNISMPLNTIHLDDLKSCYIMSLKTTALTSKFQSERKENYSPEGEPSCCTSSRDYQEELSFEKIPKIIEEKFILQLLENVCSLAKHLPTFHKDINSLYLKLRRKHEKLLMIGNNVQGLGLLGKIYHDDINVKGTEENETQFEENACPATIANAESKPTLVNTSFNYLKRTAIDIAVGECAVTYQLMDKSIQTDIGKKITANENTVEALKIMFVSDIANYTNTTQTESCLSLHSKSVIKTTEKATSSHNWIKQISTRDCEISLCFVKKVFDPISTKNCRFWRLGCKDKPISIINFENAYPDPTNKQASERKQSPEDRPEFLKEINLLSPSLKVSTPSQTEKNCWLIDKIRHKDYILLYTLCQLSVGQNNSDAKMSYSMDNFAPSLQLQSSDGLKTIFRCSSDLSYCSGLISPTTPARGPQAGFVSGTPGGRLAGWSIESGGPLDGVSRELGQAQLSLQQLQGYLDALELHQQAHHDTDVSLEGASPNVKKDRRKFGLRKKKSSNKCASVELAPPHMDASNSHMALSALTAPPSPGGGASSIPASAASLPIACAATRPQSLPGAEALNAPTSLCSLTPDQQLREDFTVLAKDLVCSLKNVVATLVRERGRTRVESEGTPLLTALRTDLSSALQQNSELRSRLSRIHDASDLAEISSMGHNSAPNRPFQHSLSYSSSCVSASEFFDAEEHEENHKQNEILNADEAGVIELDGDSTSEAGSLSSEDGSASSDNSDAATEQSTLRLNENGPNTWVRRTRLPHPRPSPGGPSLWNLLYKNIGKDLSQISMPVTINEPLNMLQRLCEELEYSELLDAAAKSVDAVDRCALVAAFAVSSYAAAAHRAASKPFNPLLAETYECVRADRAFRFVAEQVSHHPPISACHAESPRWVFWQEARIKTKFWGKSMEFQPAGRVHVKLLTTGDHYSWNKVTTCVHNLFGGQRWVDQYGDMHIACQGTDIGCKLNFVKASSWSSSRHEVRGAVTEGGSGTRLRLAGRWSEALYAGDPPAARCLWRPGAMPPEHELYYGFTRFAMELNEMEPGLRDALPHTDTRLRPDQRALEEGDVDAAEQFKHQLEQAQRERRRDCTEHVPAWFRKVLEGSEEMWSFTGEYWKAREAGFPSLQSPRLW